MCNILAKTHYFTIINVIFQASDFSATLTHAKARNRKVLYDIFNFAPSRLRGERLVCQNLKGMSSFRVMLRPMLKTPVRPVTAFSSAYLRRFKWL